jgi:hypothetical protein
MNEFSNYSVSNERDFAMVGIARPRERPAVFRWKLSWAILQPPTIRGDPGAIDWLDLGHEDISEEDR